MYMKDTQENRVIPQGDLSHHLKYHLQLKTKEGYVCGREGSHYAGDQEKQHKL